MTRMLGNNRPGCGVVTCFLLLFVVFQQPQQQGCHALFADEAGQLDLLVATAGHGATRFAIGASNDDDDDDDDDLIVVTSDGTDTLDLTTTTTTRTTSCRLAGRNATTGTLVWRRSACSSPSPSSIKTQQQQHAIVATADHRRVLTLDPEGVVRSWDPTTGNLQWETMVPNWPGDESERETQIRLVSTANDENKNDRLFLIPTNRPTTPLAVLDETTGRVLEPKEEQSQVPSLSSSDNDFSTVTCPAFGYKWQGKRDLVPLHPEEAETTTSIEWDDDAATLDTLVAAAGMEFHLVDCQRDEMTIVASFPSRSRTVLITIRKTNDRIMGRIGWTAEEGLSAITSAVLVDASHFVVGETGDETTDENLHDHHDARHVLDFSNRLHMHWNSLQQWFQSMVDIVTFQQDGTFQSSSSSSSFGFQKVAVLVSKESHVVYGMSTTRPITTTTATTTSPLQQQDLLKYQHDLPTDASWHRLVHGAPNGPKNVRGINGKAHSRDVLVVSSSHGNDGDEIISWICFDGALGHVHHAGSVTVPRPVVQLVPFPTTTTAATTTATASATLACRQGALLVLQDLSTVVIPTGKQQEQDEMVAVAAAQIKAATTAVSSFTQNNVVKHGWFAHRVIPSKEDGAKKDAMLESLRFTVLEQEEDTKIWAQVTGVAQFPNERILTVAYPNREEVVQSPCQVLGDQSLLLKYLNPHLMVILTTTTTSSNAQEEKDDDEESSELTKTLQRLLDGPTTTTTAPKKPKRKPLGVGNSNATDAESSAGTNMTDDKTTTTTTTITYEPNLFVNVVDSVSGRVLYRASHAHASTFPIAPSVLISENWILYSFVNEKSRRAEVGVLSLYEGMVDAAGLTAFTTPEQIRAFSSLNSRDSQPYVLAKTYTLPKPVTALGMTVTRGGISGKRVLFATVDGQIHGVDRKLLEPRRPVGSTLKEAEQKEGLRPYSELLPLVSYLSLSYTQTVEGVTQLLSAPTDLESQTIVLAVGGPDLFCVRTSPSRGFDVLPESFNRIMLSIVVVVLIVLWLSLQRIVFGKTIQKGWV